MTTAATTYTVRPLGQSAWAEGATSLTVARKAAAAAVAAGLSQVAIIDDSTGQIVERGRWVMVDGALIND